ncbi:hypothetical protein X748_24540 [Mesorhizobium sp. LNJC386A00]|nr:hypothetical protein X752_28940 [Mesorhizobium sp. LNJC398B00]ESY32107.1 hypothetical protein X748_24540 [Mesorhizobium sp. LNJC386A00]
MLFGEIANLIIFIDWYTIAISKITLALIVCHYLSS